MMTLGPVPGWEINQHQDAVFDVAWSPNGMQLASASRDRTVRVWDVSGANSGHTVVAHRGAVYGVAWSPGGDRLVSASRSGAVSIWTLPDGEPQLVLGDQTGIVRTVAWSPDGRSIATGTNYWAHAVIRVWAIKPDPVELVHFRTRDGELVFDLAWSPRGNYLAAGLVSGMVRVWFRERQTVSVRAHDEGVRAVAWSPLGTDARAMLVTASGDGMIKLWQITGGGTRDLAASLCATFKGRGGPIHSIAFSPDGVRMVAGLEDGAIRVCSLPDGDDCTVSTDLSGPVYAVAWSPDGSRIASGDADGSVRVWALECVGESVRQ